MFLYAFMSGASISFPHLFLRSLNEVYRSSAIGHAFIHPIFIHRILLFLGLADFPTDEPVHVVGPLGATFLRQGLLTCELIFRVLKVHILVEFPLFPLLQVLLLLTFLHRLLRMIQTFDVR